MILFKNSENVKDIEEIQLNNLRVITNQIITMSKTMLEHIEYIPEMIVNFFKRYSFDDLACRFFEVVMCACECWLEQSPNDSNFYILITKNYDKIKNDEKFIDFRNNEIAREIELFRNIPIKFAEKLYSKIYELSFNYGLKPKEISEKLQNEFIPETLEGMIKELALPESSKIFINFTKFKYKQPLENVYKKIEKIENQNRDNFSIEKLSEIEKEIKENISKLEEIEIEFEKAKESIVKYKILDRTSFFEDELKELEYISKKAFNLLYKISKEKEKIHCIVKDVGEIDPNPPYGKHGINGQYVKKTEAEQKKIEEKIKEKKEQKEETELSKLPSEKILFKNVEEMSSEYPYNNNGLFGEKGKKHRVIKTFDPVATSIDFYKKISKGGFEMQLSNGKGVRTDFDNKVVITHRIITSTKDSPAVDINIPDTLNGNIQKQKVHFIKKEE